MLQRVYDGWARHTASPGSGGRAAVQLWQRWSSGPDPETLLRTPAAQVLGRGDPSLDNLLWDGARLTLLDFEYSGWTDPAYELADLVEHPQSRATPDATWDAFMDRFALDDATRARHLAARGMLAFFWLARWRPDDARFEAQVVRIRDLLAAPR